MVSTKARKRVGSGWPFSFAWRSPCPRAHFSHRISKLRSFQPPRTRLSLEIPCCALLNRSGRRRSSQRASTTASPCASDNANYCRSQFYEEWFSSLDAQVRFLKHTLRFPCYGDPEYTFSDVERAIQREIVNRNYLARYELRLAEEQQATDLALLRQLESKYRMPVGERDQELQLAVPPENQTPVTPVQGSLF